MKQQGRLLEKPELMKEVLESMNIGEQFFYILLLHTPTQEFSSMKGS